ncbi:MAG: ABC transporter permease, partial [Balneolaceae bacterium]|nr:ABC transporter permease [Balneolaceae bacterium]
MDKAPWLPLPLGPALSGQFPEIERFVRLDQSSAIVRNGSNSFEEDVLYTDVSFFELFSFPLIQGNPETVLSDPSNIVLTPEMAEKYFG